MTTVARRCGWALADQVVSSVSNLLLLSLVARQVPAAAFGDFVLLYGYYVLAYQLAQTTLTEPVLVRFPKDAKQAAVVLRDVSGMAALTGALAAVLLIPFSMAVLGGFGAAAAALAVVLPALLVQDALRMGFIAGGRARQALLNDTVWACTQGVLVCAVLRFTTELGWLVMAWGVAGVAAALLAMAQAGVTPRLSAARDWWRAYGDLARPYFVEAVALTLSSYGALVVVARICDSATVGALRAAEILFGPVNLMIFAGRWIAIGELSRLVAVGSRRLVRAVVLVSLGLGGACAVFGALVLLMPDGLGRWLFGDSWRAAAALLPGYVLCRIAQGAAIGPSAGLRALQRVNAQFRIRVAAAVLAFGLCVGGAAAGGAQGAVAGLLAAAVLVLALMTIVFLKNIELRSPGVGIGAGATAPANLTGVDQGGQSPVPAHVAARPRTGRIAS